MSAPKLLIVDDDPHIRKLIRLYLRDSSFEILEAATGEEAIALSDEHEFRVVLLDLILPYFGGFRLCQRFKKAGAGSPYIVIMTGDDSEETRNSATDCGADGFLAKPFSGAELHEKIVAATAKK